MADDYLDEVDLSNTRKMAAAAPIVVRYFKECVRKIICSNLQAALDFEREAPKNVRETQDAREGFPALLIGKPVEFEGK